MAEARDTIAAGSLLEPEDTGHGAGPNGPNGANGLNGAGGESPRRRRAAAWLGRAAGVFRLTPTEAVLAGAGLVRRRPRAVGGVAAAVLAAGGVAVWLSVRIQPPPDYATAPIDEVFEYTLLTDDFNRLPVEERLALIGQLIERFKSFGSGDSVLLAMFASLIMGEARAQIEENVSRLMVDVADVYAQDYDPNASPDERVAYLEDAFVGMQRMFAVVDPGLADKSDEEMLEEGREQAKRDLRRFEQGKVRAGEVMRVFDIMNNKVGAHMSGHEKVRMTQMFRDMTEMLRAGP